MSITAIRAALEVALKSITPAIATAWENIEFSPTEDVPFQRLGLGRAKPDDSEIGQLHIEQGILIVSLNYPTGVGPCDAEARADLVRSTFAKGRSFSASGVTVTIMGTPEVPQGQPVEGWFVVPVKIPWRAQVPN